MRTLGFRQLHRIAGLVGLLLVAGALGFASSTAFAAGTATVTIDSALSPQNLTVAPGTTVTWTAGDAGKHRVRGVSGKEKFDGQLPAGGSWSKTFTTEGAWTYLDDEQKTNAATQGTITVSSTAPAGGGGGGGGGGGAGAPAPPAPTTAAVTLSGKAFSPASVTVAVGGTVTWTNRDGMPHNVTSSNGAFKSPTFNDGGTFTFTFTAPGTYNYVCTLHGGMSGTIIVPAANGSVPPPAPPAAGGSGAPGTPGTGGAAPNAPVPAAVAAAPGKPGKHTVTITDAGFTPATLDARAGDTVTWVNTGQMPHTATATGIFDLPIDPGGSASTILQAPGVIRYVCLYHDYMTATITVGEALAGVVIAPAPRAKPGAKGTGSAGGSTAKGGTGAAGGVAPAGGGQAKTYRVAVGDNTFTPKTLNARVGDTIIWTNVGKMPHTVTAGNGSFNQTPLSPGQSFSYALRATGTVGYVCSFHPGMSGTLVVGAALAGVAVPPPSAGGTSGGSAAAGGTSAAAALAAAPPAPAAAAGSTTKTIEIKVTEMTFTPTMVEANVGDTISWVNVGLIPHTVTAKDGSFDKTPLKPGERFNYVLRKEGSVDYVCTYHPGMDGMLMVGPALKGVTVPAAGAAAAGEGSTALSKAPASSGTAKTFEVQVKDNSFTPAKIEARVGDTISWVNLGKLPHTVTARSDGFDKTLKPGQRFNLLLTRVGTISYVCTPHPGMFGVIMVSPALTGPPPAGPPLTVGEISPIVMAGFGTGWLLLIGMLAAVQVRARLAAKGRRRAGSGPSPVNAS